VAELPAPAVRDRFAVLAPLRHPLLLARELGTLDLLSEGRLVVQPTVSWSRDEYAALGVPFDRRGAILDEQLEILALLWRQTPASFHGEFFSFDDVYLEPKAYRPSGPALWFGGQRLHEPLLRRLVRYGSGFHPLGVPAPADFERLDAAMAAAGRRVPDLELIGGTRAVFPDDHSCADLGHAMESIPAQMARGFTTFCVKPSQFTDDPDGIGPFCREVMKRAEQLTRPFLFDSERSRVSRRRSQARDPGRERLSGHAEGEVGEPQHIAVPSQPC
jgi:alkanesulfonate monooxygenase SsuD/methylene tetrahydromethanopterin reductase-like flavin-dependent oxidoreductase (luciferase family)